MHYKLGVTCVYNGQCSILCCDNMTVSGQCLFTINDNNYETSIYSDHTSKQYFPASLVIASLLRPAVKQTALYGNLSDCFLRNTK